jgi:hypothetical protein
MNVLLRRLQRGTWTAAGLRWAPGPCPRDAGHRGGVGAAAAGGGGGAGVSMLTWRPRGAEPRDKEADA